MITESTNKRQRKKRDAAYYREYRRRKKYGAANILPFPNLSSLNPSIHNSLVEGSCNRQPTVNQQSIEPLNPNYRKPKSLNLCSKNLVACFFIMLLTGVLVHLSVPFYLQGHSPPMAFLMAALVELSLLFLLTIQTPGIGDRIAKYLLIILLSAYALVPIALNPVKAVKSKLAIQQTEKQIQDLKIASIQNEISTRKQKVTILQERGRVTLAQLELQKVADLELRLRNTAILLPPADNKDLELQTSYAVAIQRLLLMLCNLFFVHHVIAKMRAPIIASKRKGSLFKNATVCVT